MMKFKLSYKFFAAFSLTLFIVAGIMIGFTWFHLFHNFSTKLNRARMDMHEGVSTALAQEYQSSKGWENLKNNHEQWEKILKFSLSPALYGSQLIEDDQTMDKKRPSRRISIVEQKALIQAVFNADFQYLVGGRTTNPEDYDFMEIRSSGKIVGWQGFPRRNNLATPLAKAFLVQQFYGLYIIGGSVLILAVCMTFFVSRYLLSPIQELTDGTRALASRNFDTRIKVSSNDEIGQLAKDFNHTAETLKHYERMRKKWIADISHELRTPLLVLTGEIEALKDGVRKLDIPAMESLYSDARHFGTIVNDLHDLSLADSGAFTFKKERIDPVNVLEKTLGHFQSSFTNKGIELQKNISDRPIVKILGDETRLTQVFSNLLQNSLQYIDGPGIIRLEQESTHKGLKIFVEDSGPGVPREKLDHLFDRLYRVDPSRSRKHGGSGLGLSICKSIVHAFGGTIRAENGQMGGLRVEIEFPKIA